MISVAQERILKPPPGFEPGGGCVFVLFSAVGGDCITDECGGAGSVFVDVVLETLVGDVHLAETDEDFVGAGVVVFGDVILQFFYQRLRLV